MTETTMIDEAELARKRGTEIRDAYFALAEFGENVRAPIRTALQNIRTKSLVAINSEDERHRGLGEYWLAVLANVGDLAKGVEASR